MAETAPRSGQSYLATNSTEYSVRLLSSISELRNLSEGWDTLWQKRTAPCHAHARKLSLYGLTTSRALVNFAP